MPTSSDPNAAVAAGDGVRLDADNLVQRVATRIRSRFAEEASGHDWHHIHRVWRLARKIAVAEGARLDVVELAALVHDIADWKFHGGDDAIGPREAERLLREEGAGDDLVERSSRSWRRSRSKAQGSGSPCGRSRGSASRMPTGSMRSAGSVSPAVSHTAAMQDA